MRLAATIDVSEEALRSAVFVERDGSTESNELVHVRHVNAVVVGVSDLRRGTDDHNAFGMQAVEDADDALSQSGAANNAVVNHDEVVHAGTDAAVGDIIDVCRQIVTRISLGDEGAHFDVFPRHLLSLDMA